VGGRRKRRQKVVRRRLTLPRTFECPRCGKISISIDIRDDKASIRCGSWGLSVEIEVPKVFSAVDAYGRFIDLYTSGDLEMKEEGSKSANEREGQELPEGSSE
jgi:transcription elongation factor Elf1